MAHATGDVSGDAAGRLPRRLHAGIPEQATLHVVTGKGGTGKTTVAAALALALARGGRTVLLVEVEARQALAQLFDLPPMHYAEQRLTTTGGGQLFGLAIDAEAAMLDYLEMFYGMKRSARGLRKIGAVDFVTTLAPGLRDVLLTGKVKEAVTRTDPKRGQVYDAVVLDAPPTGRIRPFLDATREVANLTKLGPINRQSEGVIELLHGPRTAVHLVTLLEEMPVQETVDAARELDEAGFQLGSVIVNRVGPPLVPDGLLDRDGAVDHDALVAGLDLAGVPAAHADALAAEVRAYAVRQRIQADNAQHLDAVDVPRIKLPDVGSPVDLGELHELAPFFVAGQDA